MPVKYTLLTLAALAAVGAAHADTGWRYYGGDQGGRHYSTAALIDRENVAELDIAWLHRSGDVAHYGDDMTNTSTQATPILLPAAAGESLVYCTPFNRLIALDPSTGEQRWDVDAGIDWRGDRTIR